MPILNERTQLRIGAAQYNAAQGLIRRITGIRRKTAHLEGLQIPYLRGGKGLPMLMIHGFGDRGETFGPLSVALHRHFHLVIPDMPGFGGASVVPSEQVSAVAQSAFLRRFLLALGLHAVHVVGQSMGGAIAARFADDHPEMTRSLTLISAAGPRGLSEGFQARIDAGTNLLLVKTLADFETLCDLSFARPLVYPRTMKRYMAGQWAARRDEHEAHFDRLVNPPPGEELADAYPRVSCPSQVVYGTAERIVHVGNIGAYRDGIPGAKLHMLNGVGHNPHHEATFKTARLIRRLARS